jgi:S-adenosylmethionine hydrolase
MAGVITLITDFGNSDWYLACMKGVILSGEASCTIVDITNEIPPGGLFNAAWVLKQSFHYFPRGTVHLVVVDPEVGTSRAALAARAGGFFFVGPDNGVLSLALGLHPEIEVRSIQNQEIMLKPLSPTFHGRDVFAPTAAYLAKGGKFSSLGPELSNWVRLQEPLVKLGEGFLEGRVVYVDRFGNGITNIAEGELRNLPSAKGLKVLVGDLLTLDSLKKTYAEALPGEPLALIGSSGFLEIAVRGASAKEKLNLQAGETSVVVQSLT